MKQKRSRRELNLQSKRAAVFDVLQISKEGQITPEMLDRLEARQLEMVESGALVGVDCPTTHTFTKYSYVREAVMPKGSLVIGHIHKEPHHCVVLAGRMLILNSDRTVTEIVAPATFLAGPGRKVGFMCEDTVMQNVHPTIGWPEELKTAECINELEEHLYTMTPVCREHRRKQMEASKAITI